MLLAARFHQHFVAVLAAVSINGLTLSNQKSTKVIYMPELTIEVPENVTDYLVIYCYVPSVVHIYLCCCCVRICVTFISFDQIVI